MNKNLLLVIVVFLITSCLPQLRNAKETVATVLDEEHYDPKGKGNYSGLFEYYVNGQKYTLLDQTFSGMIKGDKYKIAYDSLNPKDGSVILEEPLFEKNEIREKTIGMVLWVGKKSCSFSYNINAKKIEVEEGIYTKFQFYYKTTAKKHHELKPGALYWVEFSPSNPKRAIIYLDQPL